MIIFILTHKFIKNADFQEFRLRTNTFTLVTVTELSISRFKLRHDGQTDGQSSIRIAASWPHNKPGRISITSDSVCPPVTFRYSMESA